jgi:hypothetical protein
MEEEEETMEHEAQAPNVRGRQALQVRAGQGQRQKQKVLCEGGKDSAGNTSQTTPNCLTASC